MYPEQKPGRPGNESLFYNLYHSIIKKSVGYGERGQAVAVQSYSCFRRHF